MAHPRLVVDAPQVWKVDHTGDGVGFSSNLLRPTSLRTGIVDERNAATIQVLPDADEQGIPQAGEAVDQQGPSRDCGACVGIG